jgi:hypothetical protein
MIPAKYNLPTIWRGCDWTPVILRWKDQNGNPVDLTGWTPSATADNSYNLNPVVLDIMNGVTQLSMPAAQTILIPLGTIAWDWVWTLDSPQIIYPPILSGIIPVKQPNTAGGISI